MNKFVAGLLLLGFSNFGFATDCDTDCEGHFDKWYQGPDRARCEAEREIACQTGLTNCDTFKVQPFREGYFAAVTTVEQFHKRYNFPADATACHQVVDQISMGHSFVGYAKTLGEALTTAAQTSITAGIGAAAWAGAAKAGIEAVLDCSCKHANYTRRNENDDEPGPRPQERPRYDGFAINLVTDAGGFAVFRGDNTAQNRQNLTQRAKDALRERAEVRVASTYSTRANTLSEAICDEGTYWAIREGHESNNVVFDTVRDRRWTKCRIRTINYSGREPARVSDRYFASVVNGGRWALRTGDVDERERVLNEAVDRVGGQSTFRETGRFSTSRTTQTRVSCERTRDLGNGLQTTDAVIFLTSGTGYKSVQRALDIVEKKYRDSTCRFDVKDTWFGPQPD